MAVKKPVKKTPVKVVAKKPTITVETKKISNLDCCSTTSCTSFKHLFMTILLIANTVLLAVILVNQTRMEALRAGGQENYALLKQVFETEGYKMQQRQQLEQALQILSQPQQDMPPVEDMQVIQQQEQPEEF
ncbi:MAG: hypothetical protein PHR61_01115 [Candidatus Absconditabacteria bacterium]|nr:hypothetical protein [Candidatus Absconditabacteria bacterium]